MQGVSLFQLFKEFEGRSVNTCGNPQKIVGLKGAAFHLNFRKAHVPCDFFQSSLDHVGSLAFGQS